ncbi:MAG: hypothetical protein IJX02_03165 [Clostridia bacterium]|nr:hypothetical protein [Clostridia bacterium]
MSRRIEAPKFKIMTVEAREAYHLSALGKDFNIYDGEGNIKFQRFNSFLHNSLELSRIQSAFEAAKRSRRLKGNFVVGVHKSGGEEYPATLALINVVFDSDEKEFQMKKAKHGYVFIRRGEHIDFASDIEDHIFVKDDRLVAIEIPYSNKKEGLIVSENKYAPVETACKQSLLEGYFKFNNEKRCYERTSKRLPSSINRHELRKLLYGEEGFTVGTENPVRYVRYKRSAGSSRQGNCLFIMEPIYKEMMKWSACGLDLKKVKDRISLESYISLTLSNMEKEISIPTDSIVVIPDATSTFDSRAVSVEKDEGGCVVAREKTVTVENTIWDGQSLVDTSVFRENGYEDKGMMLLRNRFFKTCAFNTRLQKWFEDRGITDVSRLHPLAYTRAKDIRDIKMIVTDSSIKYIKLYGGNRLEAISRWLDNVEPVFGVVKVDKPTKHMNGEMVQANYQLINTLSLSKEEVKELLKPSFDYLERIMKDPMFMRYYIKMQLGDDRLDPEEYCDCEDEEEGEDDGGMIASARKNVVLKLLSLNDGYASTASYSEFRTQIKKSFLRELRKGHLVVNGTNAYLLGNGYEMLNAVTDREFDFKNPVAIALKNNDIRVSRFEDGKELLCARCPHVTMGNLFIGVNRCRENDGYDKYFNLSRQVIALNSIGENLLQRLNGCDFDSDMMLVTDNPIMLSSAKKNYDKFLVPYCGESATLKKQELWEMDRDISDNKIGQIINLSQWLNSLYWDKTNNGENCGWLYNEICKLAVLSGMEIDKAKRDYGIDAQQILKQIKELVSSTYKKPSFLRSVKTGCVSRREDKKDIYSKKIYTPMELLYAVIDETKVFPGRGKANRIGSLLPPTDKTPEANDYRYRKMILGMLAEGEEELTRLRREMFRLSDDEKTMKLLECREVELNCTEYVRRMMKNERVLRLLVDAIDSMITEKRAEGEDASGSKRFQAFALACVCNANDNLYRLIAHTRHDMYDLVQDERGDIDIYGFRHAPFLRKAGGSFLLDEDESLDI